MGGLMAIFRILEGTARPGAADRLAELLVRQEREVVANAPGIVFVQSLRSGDSVLAVSSWRSIEDMQRYLEQPATTGFYAALPELLMGVPSIRTYEVIRPAGEDGSAEDGVGKDDSADLDRTTWGRE
jgi:quinol monooxygenase YgiN